MAKYIITHGADLNSTDHDKIGLTALHIAVLNQDRFLLDLLLKSGADVNAPAQGEATRGKTSLAFAHELTKASNPVRLNEMITILKDHGAHE